MLFLSSSVINGSSLLCSIVSSVDYTNRLITCKVDSDHPNDDKIVNTVKLAYLGSCTWCYQYSQPVSVSGMGNTNNKASAKEGEEETDVAKHDEELLEAVDSLPKAKPLKSVKKPKGPKGRKPPSRNFLQTIVSYFQAKPNTTSQSETDNKDAKKEPDIVLDLNVIEKAAVLDNVTKGRPKPPGKRRPGGARRPQPTIKAEEKTAEVIESNTSETNEVKKETKIFLKPPNRSQSKWKTIGIETVPNNNNDTKEPESDDEKNQEDISDQKIDLEVIPSSETSAQPPGKPPRPSLKKDESNKLSLEAGLAEAFETQTSVEKKPKPELPKSGKPKGQDEIINTEEQEGTVKTSNKKDFLNDLNMKLKIPSQPLDVKTASNVEDKAAVSETSTGVETENAKVTPTEMLDKVTLSSDKENTDDQQSKDLVNPSKKEKKKKKGIFHKMKKLNLEATKKVNRSISKSFERKSTESEKSPISGPIEECKRSSQNSEGGISATSVTKERKSSITNNPLFIEDLNVDVKESSPMVESPNPKLYMKNVMKPNMLEELNIKLNKNKSQKDIQSPVSNYVSGNPPKLKPLLPQRNLSTLVLKFFLTIC